MMKIRHLRKSHQDIVALKDVSFDIDDGDVVTIIGESGSGKSTLIRCLNMLITPDEGTIEFNGVEIINEESNLRQIRSKIGMVSQSFNLFSNKMVIENVMMGQIDLCKIPKQQAYDEAVRILKLLGLGEKLYAYPKELSGGQKQRVAIARELAMKADIIIFDEPTSSLDSTYRLEVKAVIKNLKKKKQTMVIVSHDMDFVKEISNKVIFLDKGLICEQGTPDEIFNNPQKEKTKAFIKQLKSLSLVITSKNFDLYEMNAKIEQFAQDYDISKSQLLNIELVIEELVINSLLKHTEDIKIIIRFFEADKSIEIEILYGGDNYNPFIDEEEDIISMLVVRQFSGDYQHTYNEKNKLLLKIKKQKVNFKN